jgi:ribose transport system substrate-binding protein
MSTNLCGRLRRAGRAMAGAFTAVLVLSLAACGSSSDASSAGSSSADASCVTIPDVAAKDPQGVLAKLPADVAAAFNGYPGEILPSAWAGWKADHAAPYKVGILWQPPVNPVMVKMHDEMKSALEASGAVQIVADVAPQGPTDVPGALQLFDQILSNKPDLIILSPIASEPFIKKVDEAGQAGIPVVTPFLPVASKYAIGWSLNSFTTGVTLGTKVAGQIGGKGNVLIVRGIPGVQADTDVNTGFKAALAQCPDLKVAGEVVGNFNVADTKSAILQFLSTHTGQIDAVFESGAMTPGVIQAFEQFGRPIPVIADVGATQGGIAYAHDHSKSYIEIGNDNASGQGEATAKVVMRTLENGGPIVNTMVVAPTFIDAKEVPTVYQKGWEIGNLDLVTLPGNVFLPDNVLDHFFDK